MTPHIKGHTECYECKPKRVPKTFPVCTIRNTPDKPIHCVVWAKELLFPRLFGRCALLSDIRPPLGVSGSHIAVPAPSHRAQASA